MFWKNTNDRNLFPTTVIEYEMNIDDELSSYLIDEIYKMYNNQELKDNHACWNQDTQLMTISHLHNMNSFLGLTQMFRNAFADYLHKQGYIFEGIDITSMWANVVSKNSMRSHAQHIHANSFLSCVYYLSIPKGNTSFINFENPSSASLMYKIDHDKNPNCPAWNNYKVQSKQNNCLVFPSWIRHSVDHGNWEDDKEYRIAISANCIPIAKSTEITTEWEHTV
jgi:uncharacterized protein (TIGR02466 family)